MDLIEELDDPSVPILRACHALNVSRASVYRKHAPFIAAVSAVACSEPATTQRQRTRCGDGRAAQS
jgi:hypothetical protein